MMTGFAGGGTPVAVGEAFVLMVDDQPAKLLTYATILRGLEATLTTASSALEALDHLLKRDYAVVLIDVCMPDLDGFELAAMIRDHPRFRQTPIIFVSGVHLTEPDRLRGYECGAVDYVPVPVIPEILRAKVGIFVELYRKSQQLERLNQDLEHRVAERTAALEEAGRRKDEFLAVLAHELRNPLAAIRTASELLAKPNLSAAHLGQATSVVRRQVTQLARLIDDLVDVSRITRGAIGLQRRVIPIAEVVEQAVEASAPLLDARRHVLSVRMPSQPLMVSGDLARLAQVMSNLLNNAAKFTDPGGRISVTVEPVGEQVTLRVCDNGIGIPSEALPRVFELFTQVGRALDRAPGGLGIGLALVRELVEMHDGEVRVESDGVGRGTQAVVTLPLTEVPSAEPLAAPPAEPPAVSLPPRRIVVADDNGDAASSLALLLTMGGHEVRTAPNGFEVLRVGAEFAPHIVVLDIGMPQLDGYETARRIRQSAWAEGVTLVALTGWGQPADRHRALQAGFDAHLVKPVSDRDLVDTIGRLIQAAVRRA